MGIGWRRYWWRLWDLGVSGWVGNTMTSMGKGLDGSTFNDVLTKVSDTKTVDANTVTDPQGKVTKTTITCIKAS